MLLPLGISEVFFFFIRSQVAILPSFHNSLEFAACVRCIVPKARPVSISEKKYLHVFVDNLLHVKGLSVLSYAKLSDWKVSRREPRQYENVIQALKTRAYPTHELYQRDGNLSIYSVDFAIGI